MLNDGAVVRNLSRQIKSLSQIFFALKIGASDRTGSKDYGINEM